MLLLVGADAAENVLSRFQDHFAPTLHTFSEMFLHPVLRRAAALKTEQLTEKDFISILAHEGFPRDKWHVASGGCDSDEDMRFLSGALCGPDC